MHVLLLQMEVSHKSWYIVDTATLPLSLIEPAALGCAEKHQRERAARIVGAMSSGVYMPLVRLVAWLLFWTFGKLLGRMDLQQTHIGMMVEAQKVVHVLSCHFWLDIHTLSLLSLPLTHSEESQWCSCPVTRATWTISS